MKERGGKTEDEGERGRGMYTHDVQLLPSRHISLTETNRREKDGLRRERETLRMVGNVD